MWAGDTFPGQSDTGPVNRPGSFCILGTVLLHSDFPTGESSTTSRCVPPYLPPSFPLIYTKYLNYNAETHFSTQ